MNLLLLVEARGIMGNANHCFQHFAGKSRSWIITLGASEVVTSFIIVTTYLKPTKSVTHHSPAMQIIVLIFNKEFYYSEHSSQIIKIREYVSIWVNIYVRKMHFTSPHDDVVKLKHFPRYWPFVRGIHRAQVISPHKGQRRGALIFSLICAGINGWVNNRHAGELRPHRAHYDVTVMSLRCLKTMSLKRLHFAWVWFLKY